MGKTFGHLYKIRGIVYYRLSPYELSPLKGFLSKGIINLTRKFYNEIFFIAPPFAMTYVVMEYAKSENERISRKNPADFANDE
ncbi:cytochrome b-c1 complex subunit 8-like [Tropilaelaps mercedesae]|uniref:Cytochrome b-c1 complex subunit 8 n=1 Tax=Tropilaelaps mercedesae TaxID=418985 RepID=A0A1V9XLV5_9ACAR|nr:cytochrome b-c1 complex subunit 8-like [Tropilaelaps mercedesae]